jgi:hypothetical protein
MKSDKIKVYVAGAYTKGNFDNNLRNAITAGNVCLELDLVPFIPHLNHLWEIAYHHNYEVWLAYDMEWLMSCDCLLRLAGDSSGADMEVRYANINNIPVFYDISEIVEWRDKYETP